MTSSPPPAIVDGVNYYATAMARLRRLGSEFTLRFSTRRKEVMAAILKAPSEESVIRKTANTLPPKPQVRGYVLLAAILGSSMVFLDGSVVSLALPLLQADLHSTTTEVQWVMEIYLLFLAAFVLVGGILGDHYGRRRIFTIGITLFILASVCCGFAPNLPFLLLARAVQG
jgi:sugar phosphate permease